MAFKCFLFVLTIFFNASSCLYSKTELEISHGFLARVVTPLHHNSRNFSNFSPVLKRANTLCPENIGGAIFSCGLEICGGEDLQNPGHCLHKDEQLQCKCTPNSSTLSIPPPSITVITASIPEKTDIVVGTYALVTLSAYSNLRQSITTTLTTPSATGESNPDPVNTAAVIFAGGLSWILVGYIGEGTIIKQVLDPPEIDEPPNDAHCVVPPVKCSSCEGVLGFCVSGPNLGCVCQDDEDASEECPKDEATPECSDPKCAGDEKNKCTAENKSCDCKPKEEKEECPAEEDWLDCDACGGSTDKNGICKGDPKDNYRYKDCECFDFFGSAELCEIGIGREPGMTLIEIQALPRFDGTFSQDPNKPRATCQNAGWAAPKEDKDGSPSITNAAAAFCHAMDGNSVTRQPLGVDRQFQIFLYDFWSFFLWAGTRYDAPPENQCKDTNKISVEECKSTILRAMTTCDPDSTMSRGASAHGSCITYGIEMDQTNQGDNPPWNRLSRELTPQCNMDEVTGLEKSIFRVLASQFCAEVEKDLSKPFTEVYSNDNVNFKRSIFGRERPANKKTFDDFGVELKWTGGVGTCRQDCTAALKQIIESPCGSNGTGNKFITKKGSLDSVCGKYFWTITRTPSTQELPPDTKCNSTEGGTYYVHSGKAVQYISNSSARSNSGSFCNKLYSLGPIPGGTVVSQMYNENTPDTVKFLAEFAGDSSKMHKQVSEVECKGYFTSVFNRCNPPEDKIPNPWRFNRLNYKTGGSFTATDAKFSIAPIRTRRNTLPDESWDKCDLLNVGDHLVLSVLGFGYLDGDFGEKLREALHWCGGVTEWSFKYLDKPSANLSHEWEARGHLTIDPTRWDCVEKKLWELNGHREGQSKSICQGRPK